MPGKPNPRPGTGVGETASVHQLRQVAVDMILEASSHTDELKDDEAKPLIDWAVVQAEAAADELSQTSQFRAVPSQKEPVALLSDRLTPLRRTMRFINSLAADRCDLSPEELLEELRYLLELAERLPSPPRRKAAADRLAELTARQAELNNLEFVQATVDLLDASSVAGKPSRQQPRETREGCDRDAEE